MTLAEQLAQRIAFPTHRDRDFFLRVYETPRDVYIQRLRAIGFEGRQSVLDAGCGFGQWALALASLNARVDAFDLSPLRVEAVRRIAAAEGVGNLRVCRSTLDALPYGDGSFDALFCYGAIFLTDYRRALKEFARVLKSGGLLYFTSNDVGWYLYNLIASHKPSRDFSPRQMAVRALVNTVAYRLGRHRPGDAVSMSRGAARAALGRAGFHLIGMGGDGAVTMGSAVPGRSFFASHHYGLPAVYEVLSAKR